MGIPGELVEAATTVMMALSRVYNETDANLIEINPFVLTSDSRVMALDAKMDFDDNALFRHPDLKLLRDLDEEEPQRGPKIKSRYTEPLKFNFALRTGLNESDYIGLGQRPFLVISSFIDKRVTHKSSFQLGADFFLSPFLKDQIEHEAISLPQRDASLDQDWKRVGVFAGHELHFNKIAVVSQLGYYVYYPYDFEGRTYLRIGLKRYIGKRFFAAATLHSHGAKAEAVEFGAGIRL